MSKSMKSLEVATGYLRSAIEYGDTAGRWLGRSKRVPDRDRVRAAVELLRGVLKEIKDKR